MTKTLTNFCIFPLQTPHVTYLHPQTCCKQQLLIQEEVKIGLLAEVLYYYNSSNWGAIGEKLIDMLDSLPVLFNNATQILPSISVRAVGSCCCRLNEDWLLDWKPLPVLTHKGVIHFVLTPELYPFSKCLFLQLFYLSLYHSPPLPSFLWHCSCSTVT